MKSNENQQAEIDALEQELRLAESNYGPDDPQTARALARLAQTLRKNKIRLLDAANYEARAQVIMGAPVENKKPNEYKITSKPKPAVAEVPKGEKPTHDKADPIPMSAIIGMLLTVGGLIGLVYFFALFDTSVPSDTGRIINLGLLSDRQNGMMFSAAAGIIGAIVWSKHNFRFPGGLLKSTLRIASMLVVMLVAIAVIFPNFIGAQNKARDASVKANMRTAQIAAESYATDHGAYPELIDSDFKSYFPGGSSGQRPDGTTTEGSAPVNPYTNQNEWPDCDLTYPDHHPGCLVYYPQYSYSKRVIGYRIRGYDEKTEALSELEYHIPGAAQY